MFRHFFAASLMLAALATNARAAGGDSIFGIPAGEVSAGVKIGTFGIGPEVGYRPLHMFGVRADGGFFDFSEGFNAGRVHYAGNVHLESYGLTGDFYPFGQSFRFSAGLRLNENDIRGQSDSVRATVAGQQVNMPTSTFGAIGGKVTFDKFAPYVGVGWGGSIAPGLNFTSDFGVMFHGNPKASIAASGPAAAAAYGSGGVAAAQADLQRYVNGYDFFPVIEIGLVYKF